MQYTSILYLIGAFSAFTPLMAAFIFVIPLYIFTKKVLISTKKRMYVLILIFITISTSQFIFHLKYFSFGLVLHLSFLLSTTLLLREKKFRIIEFLWYVKLLTLVNFAMVLLYFIPIFRDVFYFDMLGLYRFRGAYLEPSIAAIASVFNLIILWLYSQQRSYVFILINLLIILLTFSGSGLVLILIVFLSQFIKNFKLSQGLLLAVGLVGSYVMIFEFLQGSFIHQRIINVLNGDFSQSTYLRFFAPFEFVQSLYNADAYSFLFGVTDPRLYIENNYSEFQYFYLWDGSATYQVNNGYAVLWGLSGLSGVMIFFLFMFYHWKKRNIVFNTFVLCVPFFTGHFVSIMYWFYIFIFIEINKRNYLSNESQ